MAVLKCKMCGGDLVFEPGATVCECEFCGSRQTLPSQDNEKKLTLFARANRLRMNSEFDKAAGIYESIVSEFSEEAEAYWGLVLCKYGIEYVDDPASGKKIPTCHRSSFDSVIDDSDFEQAMENADVVARKVYREEAKQIEEIRKGIIEVSEKEEPYDIFICYKETAEDSGRTIDSVIAQDVYDQLTDKGYRVFFSRITLEDKLGQEYEPYIFAALNSAKVMLTFGTDYEYFNAVWVKNEWSRFLKLMAKDKTKHLIPCYKNIDAYDMPKEFTKLQAQDMGKVGAIQDLLRGIEKIIGKKKSKENSIILSSGNGQSAVSNGPSVNSLIKRGFDSLEDGVYDEAGKIFNDALNINAQCAEAYLGLFMIEKKLKNFESAEKAFQKENLENRFWKRAKQYASGQTEKMMQQWEETYRKQIRKQIEEARLKKEQLQRSMRESQQKYLEMKKQYDSEEFKNTEEEIEEYQRLNKILEDFQREEKEFDEDCKMEEELEKTISELKTVASQMGFFQKSKKKELQKGIEKLQQELNQTKERCDSFREKYLYGIDVDEDIVLGYLEGSKQRRFLNSNVIKFGRYEQGDGIKEIEWYILDATDAGLLLISRYGLDAVYFNTPTGDFTWEESSIRKWMNTTFLNTAFYPEEQEKIMTTIVSADKNPEYSTNPGSATEDKIFLLSIQEVEKYFSSEECRKCVPTTHAVAQGAYVDDINKVNNQGTCMWWLRSPGDRSGTAAGVLYGGSVSTYGYDVTDSDVCVRPVLWIDLNS